MVSGPILSIEYLNGLSFGFLHSLEGFVLGLLKLILPETIIAIKKAYTRAYLPGLYKIFYCASLTRPPDFLSGFRNLAGATQRIKVDKIASQVAPAEEADPVTSNL